MISRKVSSRQIPGVVDEHVDAAEMCQGVGHHRFDFGLPGDIQDIDEHLRAVLRPDFFGGLTEQLRLTVGQQQARALRGEALSRRPADPRAAPVINTRLPSNRRMW